MVNCRIWTEFTLSYIHRESGLDVVREKRNKLCDLLGLQRPVVRVSIQRLLQYILIQSIHMQASGSRAAKPTLSASDTMASYRGIIMQQAHCIVIMGV